MKHHRINSYVSILFLLIFSYYLYSCKSINSNTSAAYQSNIQNFWFEIPVTNPNVKEPGWGDVLTDVIQHYYDPSSVSACQAYTSYYAGDQPTYAHEATHGLNACIRNKYSTQGQVYGFYLLNGKAIYLNAPSSVTKNMAGNYVPQNLRNVAGNKRFDYITGAIFTEQVPPMPDFWENVPLYIFDEWTAYSNGAREAISMLDHGRSVGNTVMLGSGALEFMVYATALGIAIEKKNPSYLQSEPKFIALYKHLATVLTHDIMTSKHNQVTDNSMRQYFKTFQTDSSASELRSWIKRNCGEDWAKETLGI